MHKRHNKLLHRNIASLYPLSKALYVFVMIRYLVFTLLLCPSIALAKCLTEYRTVSGNLSSSNMPLANAKLTFDFHDGLGELISNSITTDENGNYLIKVKYNQYSGIGFFVAEKCKFSLVKLQLKIEAKGHSVFKDFIEISSESTTYNKAFKVMDAANRGAH